MPTIREISATTTSSSMRVTPERLVLPTDDVGIVSVSAGLAVGAIADDVRLVAMLAGIAIDVGVAPRVVGNVFVRVRPLPVLHRLGLLSQGLQTLLGGGIAAGVQFVRSQRRHVGVDLRARRRYASAIG